MKAVDVAKDLIFLMDIYNIGNENTPKGKNVELSNTKLQKIMYIVTVSYTHLTLPTKA